MQSKLDQNDSDLVAKTSEIVQLKQSLAKLSIEKNELTSQLYDQQLNYLNANNELKNQAHTIKELTEKLDLEIEHAKNLTKTNDDLVKQISNLQTENNSLKATQNSQLPSDLLNHPTELLKLVTLLIPSARKTTLNENLTNIAKLHVLYVSINNQLYQVST
ncbi:hypothetical protein J6W20_00405 [bacterium]|nr:hypothetical protein [bacterium]